MGEQVRTFASVDTLSPDVDDEAPPVSSWHLGKHGGGRFGGGCNGLVVGVGNGGGRAFFGTGP